MLEVEQVRRFLGDQEDEMLVVWITEVISVIDTDCEPAFTIERVTRPC